MSTIITKNSATSGSQPSSLIQGELAINVTDGRLFYGSGSGNIVKEFTIVSASYADTASYVQNAQTASYITTAQTASYVLQAVSASYAPDTTFPYTGSAKITGSLGITGSLSVLESGVNSLNTTTYTLRGVNGNTSIDWGNRELRDGSNAIAVNWRLRNVFDNAQSESINWNSRRLYSSNSNVILDWNTGNFTGTASYATQALSASFSDSSSYALSASWAPGGGGIPGGADTTIQFNDSGSFNGSSAFAYIKTKNSLQQGNGTSAIGLYSHAEGYSTQAIGNTSHAEGSSTRTGTGTAYLASSVVNGLFTLSSSYGDQTGVLYAGERVAFDDSAYLNNYGYAYNWIVSSSAYDGIDTTTVQLLDTTINTDSASIANILGGNSGDQLLAGYVAHAEGEDTTAFGIVSHAEGSSTYALGGSSHAEGSGTQAIGASSHAEGSSTQAIGDYSHAEGVSTITYAPYSHAEGQQTIAGWRAYEAGTLIANGVFELQTKYGDLTADFTTGEFVLIDDANGEINGTATVYKFEIASSTYNATPATEITLVDTSINTTATYPTVGLYGNSNPLYADAAIGQGQHAQGSRAKAIGVGSNAAGYETFALGWYQSVVGQYNDPVSTPSAFIVGDGDASTRHNLLVASTGSVVISGSLLVSGSIISTTGATTKANAISSASFGGTPLTSSITFTTPYPNSSYSVVVTGEDARIWTIESKTASGFTINSNSNIVLAGDTYWQSTSYGEFNN